VRVNEDRSILTRAATPPDQTLTYGPEPEQLADIRSGAGAERRPLLMLVHGGFWRPAYDRLHLASLSVRLAGIGHTVATIEYRRLPGKPAHTCDDMRRALECLPITLKLRHDGRVILMGHSAGGHLVLWGASQAAVPRLTGVLALAPVADVALALELSLGDGAAAAFLGPEHVHAARYDPRRLPTPSMKACIVHGESDEIVPIAVSESYVASHPATKLMRLPITGHFALIDPESGAWSAVSRELQSLAE
jgi:acetyl esterase/lipase